MGLYYFDTQDGDVDTDEQGVELANDQEAVRQAIKYAGSMVSDRPDIVMPRAEFMVSARTANGRVLARVRVSLEQLG